jgi:hypothetical protein
MGCVHGCGQSLQSLSLRDFLKGTSPNVSIMYTNVITHMDSWFIPPITRVNLGMVYIYIDSMSLLTWFSMTRFLMIFYRLNWSGMRYGHQNCYGKTANLLSLCYNLWSCEWRIGPHVLQRISAE